MTAALTLAEVFETMSATLEREDPAPGDVANIGGSLARVAAVTRTPGGLAVTLVGEDYYVANARHYGDGGGHGLAPGTMPPTLAPYRLDVSDRVLADEGLTRAAVRLRVAGSHRLETVHGVTVRAWKLKD